MKERDIIAGLIERHDNRMETARTVWPGEPICPDCYLPLQKHSNVYWERPGSPLVECELALSFGVVVAGAKGAAN